MATELTFAEYARRAWGTAVYPKRGQRADYPFFGLAGEAGEVMEKRKKYERDAVPLETFQQQLKKELGDCLWYLNALAHEYGLTLEEVARHNLEKLESRQQRGCIRGDGDER